MTNARVKGAWVFGAATALLGALLAAVPVWLLPPCAKLVETAAGGTVPMKCHWSGQAEIGIGLLILCGGIIMMALGGAGSRDAEDGIPYGGRGALGGAGVGASMMCIAAAALGIAVPALLIGGCAMETMTCRISTFPAVYALCALAIAVNAAHIALAARRGREGMA